MYLELLKLIEYLFKDKLYTCIIAKSNTETQLLFSIEHFKNYYKVIEDKVKKKEITNEELSNIYIELSIYSTIMLWNEVISIFMSNSYGDPNECEDKELMREVLYDATININPIIEFKTISIPYHSLDLVRSKLVKMNKRNPIKMILSIKDSYILIIDKDSKTMGINNNQIDNKVYLKDFIK